MLEIALCLDKLKIEQLHKDTETYYDNGFADTNEDSEHTVPLSSTKFEDSFKFDSGTFCSANALGRHKGSAHSKRSSATQDHPVP